ncbi:MAG: hypothetical protein KIT45_12640 [Fimbriimonadia bacterium]|nr:hypothetical protein [Fimbriimonadia bacterium]
MPLNPLASPENYQAFLYGLPQRYSIIKQSTIVYVPLGALFGKTEGTLVFERKVVLCALEYLNFELSVIEGYGYEVSSANLDPLSPHFPPVNQYCSASFPDKNKHFWYDPFPHPNDPTLASTHPHHKHVHPNIKRNRIPAPNLSFTRPNLPFLIEEIAELLESQDL